MPSDSCVLFSKLSPWHLVLVGTKEQCLAFVVCIRIGGSEKEVLEKPMTDSEMKVSIILHELCHVWSTKN